MESKYTFNEFLYEISQGKREVTIKLPNLENTIKGIVTEIDLTNPKWKPIKVHILTKNLTITDFRFVEKPFVGEVKEEYQRPYTNDWFMLQFITNIDFESDKQIELML
jgi:hypothetical protein